MTPVQKPDDADKTPTGEVSPAGEPELLDDSEIFDADDAIVEEVPDAEDSDAEDSADEVSADEVSADEVTGPPDEVLEADDGIIECLDDDVSEEVTGEADADQGERSTGLVTAPERVLEPEVVGEAEPVEDDDPDETTGEHEVSPELVGASEAEGEPAADPLASFATDPERAAEVDEYASSEDTTGQLDMPERPPWEPTPEESTPPFGHEEAAEAEGSDEPTGRVDLPFEQDQDDQTSPRPEGPGRDADEPDHALELEPVGRRRRSRRRPTRPASEEEFVDESDDTAPTGKDGAGPWEEDTPGPQDEAAPAGADSTLNFDDDTSLEGDIERRTETKAGQDDVRWSALPEDEPRAMPDVGPTRVDGQSNPLGPQAEKTLIFDDPSADLDEPAEPEVPFLVIVQGEEEGREIELHREEVTLGRGPENDLVFPDIACSRRHAMVERQGDDWLVIDFGSGNGTLVNGRRIQREVLRDGDEIEVGSTVIQFNRPEAYGDDEPLPDDRTPPPHSTTVSGASTLTDDEDTSWLTRMTSDPRQRRYLIYGGAALGGLILLMLIIKLAVGFGPSGPTPEEIQHKRALEQRRQFDEHMTRAKSLVVSKKWKDAQLEAQLAQKIEPNSGQARDYVEYIRKELAAASAIDQARLAISDQNWDTAVAALARISEESEYHEEAMQLKTDLDTRVLDGLLTEGLRMMKAEQYNQALLKFEEIIKRDQENKEAVHYRDQCNEKIDQAERSRRLASRSRRRRSRRRRKPRTEKRSSGSLTGQALALYRNGEIDRAIEKAELSGSAEHQKQLRQFRSAYQQGEKLAKRPGQISQALKELNRAKGMDRKISGGRGKYNDRLNELLGKVYFVKGVDSNMRQRYPEAYKAFNASRKYDSSNTRVGDQLRELEKKAKKFYEEAYVIKSTNAEAALKKLEIVVRIVPANHVYYTKAKNLKAKIQGPLGSSGSSSGF